MRHIFPLVASSVICGCVHMSHARVQCTLHDEYMLAVQQQATTNEPSIDTFYEIWKTRLADAVAGGMQDGDCRSWTEGELMALYGVTGNIEAAITLARNIFARATTPKGSLIAANNLIGFIQRRTPTQLNDESRAECCSTANIAIGLCPAIDSMIHDASNYDLLPMYAPLLHVRASCQPTPEAQLAELQNVVHVFDQVQQTGLDAGIDLAKLRQFVWKNELDILYSLNRSDEFVQLLDHISQEQRGVGGVFALTYWDRAKKSNNTHWQATCADWIVQSSDDHFARSLILSDKASADMRAVRSNAFASSDAVNVALESTEAILSQIAICRERGVPREGEGVQFTLEQLSQLECSWKTSKVWLLAYHTTRRDDSIAAFVDVLSTCPVDSELRAIATKLGIEIK